MRRAPPTQMTFSAMQDSEVSSGSWRSASVAARSDAFIASANSGTCTSPANGVPEARIHALSVKLRGFAP
jgi:hypothetical protein